MEAYSINCPHCAAPINTEQKECEYCHQPVILPNMAVAATLPLPEINKYAGAYRKAVAEHPDSHELNTSLGICYLRLKMYDKALEAFEKAMPDNFDSAEPFFLAAVCLLKGKKPFLTPRASIDKIEEYLNAAAMIEQRVDILYFMSYIKRDYFDRKYLNTSPTSKELLDEAVAMGLTNEDIAAFHALAGTPVA